MTDISVRILKAFEKALTMPPCLKFDREGYNSFWYAPEHVAQFLDLYARLEDQESRDVFLKVIGNSIGQMLAGEVEEFCNYTQVQWRELENKAFQTPGLFPSYPVEIVQTFGLEAYSYGDICRAQNGEIVLDCGAYTGNTARYFADLVGPSGVCHAFEPMPHIFAQLDANVRNSPYANIFPHNYALLDKPGTMRFTNAGAASRAGEKDAVTISAISIDDFCLQNNLPRVDFIKMDVESAEKAALQGAVNTIRNFSPKLAISAYHRWDDFTALPEVILQINPRYHFYFKHNCYNFWESLLFAVPRDSAKQTAISQSESDSLATIYKVILAAHHERQKLLRDRLLSLYDAKLRVQMPWLPQGLFDVQARHMYYPISAGGDVHYKFAFVDDKAEISLFIKGNCAKGQDIIKEICTRSLLSTPLQSIFGNWNGCRYLIAQAEEVDAVAAHMQYLVEISRQPLVCNHVAARSIFSPDKP